jgi:hypothetical protein
MMLTIIVAAIAVKQKQAMTKSSTVKGEANSGSSGVFPRIKA